MHQRQVMGRGRRRQRGAVAIFAAVALLGVLASTVLVIEVGRLYLAHRNLQKMASMAALDASRMVSGCGLPASSDDELQAVVNASLARNGDPTRLRSIDIEHGVVETADTTALRSLSAGELGTAEAVRVTLTAPFPDLITAFLAPADRIMTASATARQAALGSLSVGGGLSRLNAGILNALLSALLGGNVNLTAVDYSGLNNVDVSLQQLALALDLEAKDLSDPVTVSTQTPLLSDLLDGLASALSGETSAAVPALLRDLAAAASGNPNGIPLGDVLGTVSEGAPGLPYLNLLDLVIALGQAAQPDDNGEVRPIALPISLAMPGVTSANTFLSILEPAQPSGLGRAGHTSASTAQLRLQLRLQVDTASQVSNALSALLAGAVQVTAQPINLGIDFDIARASAFLDQLDCPTRDDPSPVAELSARTALATLTLGTFSGNPATAPPLASGRTQLTGITTRVLFGLGPTVVSNVFLARPVSAAVGSGGAAPLQPVTHFSRAEDAQSKPYWSADRSDRPGPSDRAAVANPQTVGSSQLLGGTLASLADSLDLSASDPNDPGASSQVCVTLALCVPLGSLLDNVLDGVQDSLDDAVTSAALVDSLLDPLLAALGVRVGAATVTFQAVSINQPHIVTQERPLQTP